MFASYYAKNERGERERERGRERESACRKLCFCTFDLKCLVFGLVTVFFFLK